MKLQMINQKEIPTKKACSALEVSKSTYYHWKNTPKQKDENQDIKKNIEQIALEYPFYGYRRITKELVRKGTTTNHKKVLRIMREENLLCKRKKAYKPITTQSNHGLKIYPNLVKNITITKPNQVWVADITYIHLLHDFIYLAAIIDRFSRKCVGWALSRNIDTQLALDALLMAFKERASLGFEGLIHHSDRGVQYASKAYVEALLNKKVVGSMSSTGNAYDNAFAESWMKTFKIEEVYMNEYENYEQAHNDIKKFIEEVYNKKRLHSAIGYVPPEEYEQKALMEAQRT